MSGLPERLVRELRRSAPELLEEASEVAAHYAAVAIAAAGAAGADSTVPLRLAAAATLLEAALTAHAAPAPLPPESILVADLRLALAAELAAEAADAGVQAALARAVMDLAAGIPATNAGLRGSPRAVLGAVVAGSAAAVAGIGGSGRALLEEWAVEVAGLEPEGVALAALALLPQAAERQPEVAAG
ncbi:MAG TPA: hypothetical protein VG245_10060 [Candidatus Dormibacteraeota bacterium]|jgi:hypothetical protein|nr:hypothetical protein [Candidatus Dormibacteraeota bacterium]